MRIGTIDIPRPVALAPMEDVSDTPFRILCKERGADLVYTEFTSCEALIRNVKNAVRKIQISDAERPVAIQLYGSAEDSMQQAAEMATEAGADFIDINCGCWVKKVANRGDGAGLLRDISKFRAVVEAVQRGTHLPVTVKTRLGWDHNSIVICDVARMLVDLGVQVLTLHCRTRSQGYTGQADWSWLPKVKAAADIQLMANGDIRSPQDAKTCFDMGCDGVMLGRAAIHSHWIFSDIKHFLRTGTLPAEPSLRQRVDMCVRHLSDSAAYRGERRGVLSFRSHYAGYLKGYDNIAQLRKDLMDFEELAPIIERLYRFVDDYERGQAAGECAA
jgi:tRNA-dihydrouridine synthase B